MAGALRIPWWPWSRPTQATILPPGRLQTERLDSGRRVLLRDLRIRINGLKLRIPAGFTTDFSSWPSRLPQPPLHATDHAGLAHDAAYRWGALAPGGKPITRREADRIWYVVARSGATRATWIGAMVGYLGLRAFGWAAWRRCRRAQAS